MGVTLSCGMTLADFLYHRGTWRYPPITHPHASKIINDNHKHCHNSDEFINSSSLTLMLTTQSSLHNTLKPREHARATSTCHTVCFFMKKHPLGKYLDSSNSAGMTACRQPFLPLITHVPHKHIPKAMPACRGNMVLKNGRQMK